MTFQSDLSGKIQQIFDLASKKLTEQWLMMDQGEDDLSVDEALDLLYVRLHRLEDRFNVFLEAGDPADVGRMLDAFADPSAVAPIHIEPGSTARPSPLSPDTTVAAYLMEVGQGYLPAANAELSGWSGAPADFLSALIERYGGRPRVGDHQLTFVVELGAVADACRRVLSRSRTDIMSIADAIIEKLNKLYDGHFRGGSADFPLVIAGAVATVADAGPWVSVALSLGGYLNGMLNASHHDPGHDSREITGATVNHILTSAFDQIDYLRGLIANEEALIGNVLRADLGAVGDAVPYSTKLRDSTLQAFELTGAALTSDPSQYSRPHVDNIQLNLEEVYKIGRVHLSAAACAYDQARLLLDSATGSGEAFGKHLLDDVKPSFLSLRDDLDTVLTNSRDYLERSADAMCMAVAFYARADGISEESLRRAADLVAARDKILTMHQPHGVDGHAGDVDP